MAAPAHVEEFDDFDPLRDFAGMWNTHLAERYLPLPGAPFSKYECADGRLVLSPAEASSNAYGAAGLIVLMSGPARAAGFFVYGSVNLAIAPDTWIQPDLTVLHRVPQSEGTRTWVPADHCTMPVEFVSRSSRRRDRIDKPRLCATAGVPYFMRVEIEPRLRHVAVALLRLGPALDHVEAVHAVAGQRFTMAEPFELSFDPAELLEP